jgi:hypothetical protein
MATLTSRTLQTVFSSLIIALTILVLLLQLIRYFRHSKNIDNTDKNLWIIEGIAEFLVLLTTIGLIILYWEYSPTSSPGCLPSAVVGCVAASTKYGVVASNVNPIMYSVSHPPVTYPATTYAAAVQQFENYGLSTGFFSWDGVAVTILTTGAAQLASGNGTPGNSWVFQNIYIAVGS